MSGSQLQRIEVLSEVLARKRSSWSRPITPTSGRRWPRKHPKSGMPSEVGRETLRRWMMADGVWLSRNQPRLRREIVENKRLSHALAIVKAQQELRLATKVMTNSEKTGYKKRVRNVSGPSASEPAKLYANR